MPIPILPAELDTVNDKQRCLYFVQWVCRVLNDLITQGNDGTEYTELFVQDLVPTLRAAWNEFNQNMPSFADQIGVAFRNMTGPEAQGHGLVGAQLVAKIRVVNYWLNMFNAAQLSLSVDCHESA